MDAQTFQAIPPAMWAYYQELLYKNAAHPLLQAIRRQGEEPTWQGINQLFSVTAKNTALDSDRLLQDLGFDDKNFDQNYLQAVFGIMRAINMLHGLDFLYIRPLRPKKNQRECDLLGEHKGARFAIEVLRSIESAYRFSDHEDPVHNLENYIARRFNEKRSQLEATMRAYQCSKALLVVVMDSPPAKQLTGSDEWKKIAEVAFVLMDNPANTHLFIFAGSSDPHTGRDEYAVFPPLVKAW